MAFILRSVIRNASGATVIFLERHVLFLERHVLRARTLDEAKREADGGIGVRHGIEPNALEIIDKAGLVVAQRSYKGKNVYAPWT